MKLIFIRHGKTKGNLEGRYTGCTDEPLCSEGIKQIHEKKESGEILFDAEMLFVSPMLRCRQTAELLFPGVSRHCVESFREYDFGEFEGKNHEELIVENELYKKWLESNGAGGFPVGEGLDNFMRRTGEGFLQCIKQAGEQNVATAVFVVHGGTIMSLMSQFYEQGKAYYDYQCRNAGGYITVWDEKFPCHISIVSKL